MSKEHEPLRKKVKTVAVVAAAILRTGAGFIACPGDDIAIIGSSFAVGADQSQHPEQAAILPEKPKVVFERKGKKKPQI